MIHPVDFDPFDVLERHVRSIDLQTPLPEISDDDLIRLIVGDELRPTTVVALRAPRRRRRWIIGVGIVAVASGGVATAALIAGQHSPAHTVGASCASRLDLQASQITMRASDDPIPTCTALWKSGALAGLAGATAVPAGTAPALVACIAPTGAVEVFPVVTQGCATLGLADADVSPEPPVGSATITVAELNERLIEAVNLRCLTQDDAAATVRQILDASGYPTWQIAHDPRPGPCFSMVVVEDKSLVQLVSSPDISRSTNNTGD